ncbi:hypothetical protein [Gilvibacter sediminis]|nr:hypothetical protein [Gilvibacter sediminis]
MRVTHRPLGSVCFNGKRKKKPTNGGAVEALLAGFSYPDHASQCEA